MNRKRLGVACVGMLLVISAVSLASPALADSTTTVNIKNGAGSN